MKDEKLRRGGAENQIDLLKKAIARSQEQTAEARKERDEAVAGNVERDAQLAVLREVQLKMSGVDKELNSEIASLRVRAENAEKLQAESELARKKAELDLQVLHSEREAADRAHALAVETFEAERIRLNGEVSSLQAALSESRSLRRWTESDIPRELKVEFLTKYLGTRESQVTCRRINGYYMCHGFSQQLEQLVADDPHLDPSSFRYFPNE